MAKPKIKVREIKKDIKVTEIKKEEPSLEVKVQDQVSSPSPVTTSSRMPTPTLAQHVVPQFTPETRAQVREGIQGKDREFSYLSDPGASRRTYDASIRQSPSDFLEARPIQPQRITPTLQPRNPVQDPSQQQSRDIREALSPTDLEPALRRTHNARDYNAEKYVAKRRRVE